MKSAPPMPQSLEISAPSRTLQVDFTWMKFKNLITAKDDPESKPIYTMEFKTLKPQLVFKSADNSSFASGILHPISINAECDLHGQPIALKALKRFKTSYSHLSYAFSDTDTPVPMTWTSTSDFKTWDFICLDPQQNPVAKFSANIWALKKVGNIEFLGPKANSDAVRDEIVVTGMTLFYCMIIRTSSILSFFGAVFSRPGRGEKDVPTVGSEQVAGSGEGRVDNERVSDKTKISGTLL